MSDTTPPATEQDPFSVVPTALVIMMLELLNELQSSDPELLARLVRRFATVDGDLIRSNPESTKFVRLIASLYEVTTGGG